MSNLTSIRILYIEELKATMRGRFAWLAAAVVLLAVGGLSVAGTQDVWLVGYGILAYGLVPLAFIPMAAAMISSARANRFVECVFTAPVERRDWLAAKVLVLLTLATFYYLALAPMMLVYVVHVGVPPLLHKFLIWTPGLLLASICVGMLIGVLFIGRSVAAPAGTGMGVLLTYAALIPLQELLVAQGNGATRSGHIALASPAVLLKNALGFTLVATSIPSTTSSTWIVLAASLAAMVLLATWVFLRTQGVETWEATVRQRWTIAIAIVAIAACPIVFADANYESPAPRATNAPVARGIFSRNFPSLALVHRTAAVPFRCCSPLLNREEWQLATDQPSERDLIVLLPVETMQHITHIHLQIAGENGLEITAVPAGLDQDGDRLEQRSYPNDSGPATASGSHIVNGWVARIPVTLNPKNPWDIGGNRYPLSVVANYQVDGDSESRMFQARGGVDAGVGSALYQMSLAAGILPLICLGAAFTRWRRTR